MCFRARLFLTSLETRENPSTPTADPFGGDAPPPSDPPPAPTTPVQTAEDACIAGVTLPPTTPPAPPVDTTHLLYQLP
jgi:hypothetical protein